MQEVITDQTVSEAYFKFVDTDWEFDRVQGKFDNYILHAPYVANGHRKSERESNRPAIPYSANYTRCLF
jgi:hypothetical protein